MTFKHLHCMDCGDKAEPLYLEKEGGFTCRQCHAKRLKAERIKEQAKGLENALMQIVYLMTAFVLSVVGVSVPYLIFSYVRVWWVIGACTILLWFALNALRRQGERK